MKNLTGVVWKVLNPKTEQYSSGGSSPKWTKTGKVWTSKRNAILHLRMFSRDYYSPDWQREMYRDAKLVKLRTVIVDEESAIDIIRGGDKGANE